MAPAYILHNAGFRSHLDIVARFDNAHDGHLHAADEVRKRVLKAERDSDAADAKGGDERVGVDTEARVEDGAAAYDPDDGAYDVHENAARGQGVVVSVEKSAKPFGDDVRHGGRDDGQDNSPENVSHPFLGDEFDNVCEKLIHGVPFGLALRMRRWSAEYHALAAQARIRFFYMLF